MMDWVHNALHPFDLDGLVLFLTLPNPFDWKLLRRWSQTWLAFRIDCLRGGHVWSEEHCHDCGKKRR